jgi:hypothetical protein
VLLARHKNESKMYAIKVLQKQAIMKRNEVKLGKKIIIEQLGHKIGNLR